MNFVIYAIVNKKTNEVPYQGFYFTKLFRNPLKTKEQKKVGRQFEKDFLADLGLDQKNFRVSFAHFQGLKKLRKSLIKSYWGQR